jgi:hypothetical protein
LEKLTIRELRALLPNEEDAPGFSTLKLKREIVDYIWKRTRQQQQQQQQQHQQQQQQLAVTHNNDNIEPYSSVVAPATATATAGTVMSTRVRIQRASIVDGAKHTVWKRRSNSLPPPPATTTISTATATATAMEEIDSNKVLLSPPPPQQQRTLSPKDKIMLDVLRRYPPLRTSMLGLNMEDDDTEDSSMQKLLVL